MKDIFLDDVSGITIDDLVDESLESSKGFKALIREGLITKNQVRSIQKQLAEEYEMGKVLQEGLVTRLLFILTNAITGIDVSSLGKISHFLGEEGVCPYCTQKIESDEVTCITCGYNLEYEGEIEDIDEDEAIDLLTDLLVTMNDMDEDTANALLDPPDDDEDEDDSFCFRLDESLDSNYDKYDLCFYKVLESMVNLNDLFSIVNYHGDSYNLDEDEKLLLYDDILDNNYCSGHIHPEYWNDIGNKLKKTDLQDILRRYNLKISGNKNELIERIGENINVEEIEFTSIASLPCDEDYYLVTPKALKYLEEHKYIKIFEACLHDYHYGEYKEYLIENKDISIIEATLSFLKLHEEKALKEKDQFDYTTHLFTQSSIYALSDNLKNYFKAMVKYFVAYLNPIDIGDISCYVDYLIHKEALQILQILVKDYDYDLEEAIKDTYDEIDYTITVPLDVLMDNIPRLLKNKNISKLDDGWKKKYLPTHVLT